MIKCLISVCVAYVGLCASTFGSVILSVTPISQNVGSSGTASVDIDIAGLGNGVPPSLGAFDINIAFDSTVLGFNGAAYGDHTLGDQLNLTGAGSITTTTPGTGTVELFELSLDPATVLDSKQASSFRLATLSFAALNPGISDLTINVNALADSQGNSLAASVAGATVDVSNGTNTPEPMSFFLAAVGIGLGSVVRCRRGKC
jgi:hypothetical protein